MTKLIAMSSKELSRTGIIRNLIDQRVNGTEATKQLGLSTRQVRRIKSRVVCEGTEGIIRRRTLLSTQDTLIVFGEYKHFS